MITQHVVWVLTLAGIGIVALTFVYVLANSGKTADAAVTTHKAYSIRRWWFIALIVFGVAVTYLTLTPFPIGHQGALATNAQMVDAVGRQWSWQLSRNEVRAGTPVQFNVSSVDVNHGFAIYGPDDLIVTQTQAMPGFTNRLLHTFTRPGTYRVMCLEYCGLAHHAMVAQFEVVPADNGGQP
ncbi:MAG: cytochrome oxidase [Rhodanobacter sp.]